MIETKIFTSQEIKRQGMVYAPVAFDSYIKEKQDAGLEIKILTVSFIDRNTIGAIFNIEEKPHGTTRESTRSNKETSVQKSSEK